ncbi:pyridoxal 5'-phosphate synthase-like subunit PDX1.2, partial [Tanacetum coccineum]
MVNSTINPNLQHNSDQNFNQDSNLQNMMNDLFHLASSDHPGMMLTTTPFNGGNFLGWSRTIKMALGAKFKLGFIDGSSPKPAVIHNDYQRWVRCDYMVTCWILNSMVAELSESFLYAQSASDLWKELEERYGQSNGPLIYHVERELSKVSQGNSSIATYFNKLKKFWDELHSLNGVPVCNCGKMRECTCRVTEKFLEIDSRSKLMQFLMRLNDDFEAVRNQILSMDPLPNLNKAYYIVQQVEKQKQVTHQVADPTAFFANNKGNQNVRKDNRSDGKSQGGDKKSCTFCNQDGHVYEQCFEKWGYPDWYKGKKNKKGNRMASQVVSDFSTYMTKETPFDFEFKNGVQDGKGDLDQRLVAAVCQEMMKIFKGKEVDHSNNASTLKPHAGTFFNGCKPYKVYSFHVSLNILSKHLQLDIRIDWIVDTGASDHMSPYLHLFQSIRILKKPIRIKLPDGTSKWVDKVGSIQINSSLILHNVFYVPDFKVNLLSVGKLLKSQNLIAVFFPTVFFLQDPSTKKVLAVGEGFNNLYICKPSSGSSTKHPSIPMPTFPVMSSFVNKDVKTEDVTLDTFHARLGHTSVSKLIHVDSCKQQNVTQLSCDTCLLAKQHRLPFPISHTRSLVAFELIHVDLWGPYKAPALNGAHYFFTIVDDFSRCTWTYLLHTKDQVLSILSDFMAYIANHFKAKPKFLRSDNGTEIVNNDCLAYLRKQGIVHQRSMVYTPQQNAIVERKHRHLLDTARALKFHSGLPNKFWGDC